LFIKNQNSKNKRCFILISHNRCFIEATLKKQSGGSVNTRPSKARTLAAADEQQFRTKIAVVEGGQEIIAQLKVCLNEKFHICC
jgi:hypothetical protein